jgi:cytidine deaminase
MKAGDETALVRKAKEARRLAYSPYSGVKIGAAVLTSDGFVYSGCNIENSSYGLSLCAERSAILKAVSEGHRRIKTIAVVGDSEEFTSPCGACRQVLFEFGENAKVIRRGIDGFHAVESAKKLLPNGFKPRSLKK